MSPGLTAVRTSCIMSPVDSMWCGHQLCVLWCSGPAGGSWGGELRVCMQEHFRSSVPHHQDHVDPRHQGRLSRPAGHQRRLSAHMEGTLWEPCRHSSVTHNRTSVMIDCTSRQHLMKMHSNACPWSYCEHSSMHNTLESHFILSGFIHYVLSCKLIFWYNTLIVYKHFTLYFYFKNT